MNRPTLRAIVRLVLWTLAINVPVLALFGFVRGPDEVLYGIVACGLCLAVAVLSLERTVWAFGRGPLWQMGFVLGGMLVRGAVVLGGGLVLFFLVPRFAAISFLVWLVCEYLLTLFLETWQLLAVVRPSGRID